MIDLILDDLDVAVLNELELNSRISFAALGRKVGLSPSATRERVQKLEDRGVITKYGIVTNHKLLGYDIEAFILVKVFHGKLNSFLNVIGSYPEVRKAYRIAGEQNLHLEVVVKDRLQLQNLIDQLMLYGDTNTQLILSEVNLHK